MIVYAVEFNPCIYESEWGVIELYGNEETAKQMLEVHSKEYLNLVNREAKVYEKWRVEPYEVKP